MKSGNPIRLGAALIDQGEGKSLQKIVYQRGQRYFYRNKNVRVFLERVAADTYRRL